MGAKTDASTTKYEIRALFEVDGVVEKPDIIGAIYGQTDGLLSEDLDIRELQKTGRIGRINVEVYSEEGKTKGRIIVPSSLSRVETAILAATLETIDRVGPCSCTFQLEEIVDVRINKRKAIVDRAAEIIRQWDQNVSPFTSSITLEVEKSSKLGSVVTVGRDGFAAGPGFEHSQKVILVEGRADVGNLLKYGIDNTIAVNGTSVSPKIVELLKNKTVTAFLDGDRGGDLILKELLQVAHVDYVARAPKGKEVEDLTQEEITKALKEAVPLEKAVFLTGTDEGLTVAQFLKNQQRTKIQQTQRNAVSSKVQRVTPIKQHSTPQTKIQRTKQLPSEMQQKSTPTRSRRNDRTQSKQQTIQRKPQQRRTQTHKKVIQKVKLPDYLVSVVDNINQKLEAVIIGDKQEIILKAPASEIYEKLSEIEKASALVIDGVVTQRLLDRAYTKGINMIIGARLGDITKKPTMLKLLEFKQIYR
ncbi:MAG: DNA primase DnaG [Candidatus Heimdallarchaeaceae archaeon]